MATYVLKITREKKKFFGQVTTSVTYQRVGHNEKDAWRKRGQINRQPDVIDVEVEVRN